MQKRNLVFVAVATAATAVRMYIEGFSGKLIATSTIIAFVLACVALTVWRRKGK